MDGTIMKLLSVKEAAEIISQRTGKPLSPRQLRHEIQLGYLKAEIVGNPDAKRVTYAIKESALKHYQRRPTGVPARKK